RRRSVVDIAWIAAHREAEAAVAVLRARQPGGGGRGAAGSRRPQREDRERRQVRLLADRAVAAALVLQPGEEIAQRSPSRAQRENRALEVARALKLAEVRADPADGRVPVAANRRRISAGGREPDHHPGAAELRRAIAGAESQPARGVLHPPRLG